MLDLDCGYDSLFAVVMLVRFNKCPWLVTTTHGTAEAISGATPQTLHPTNTHLKPFAPQTLHTSNPASCTS